MPGKGTLIWQYYSPPAQPTYSLWSSTTILAGRFWIGWSSGLAGTEAHSLCTSQATPRTWKMVSATGPFWWAWLPSCLSDQDSPQPKPRIPEQPLHSAVRALASDIFSAGPLKSHHRRSSLQSRPGHWETSQCCCFTLGNGGLTTAPHCLWGTRRSKEVSTYTYNASAPACAKLSPLSHWGPWGQCPVHDVGSLLTAHDGGRCSP